MLIQRQSSTLTENNHKVRTSMEAGRYHLYMQEELEDPICKSNQVRNNQEIRLWLEYSHIVDLELIARFHT